MINDELSFNEIIRLLCDHALIELIKDSNGYSMHSCVHAWAAHVLNADRETSMAKLALICVSAAVPTKHVGEYWVIERRLLPHAHKCWESIVCDSELELQNSQIICDAVHNLGFLFADQSKIKEAMSMYQRALKGYEKVFEPNHKTMSNLGGLYESQGKMEEAEAMYQRALKGFEKAWGSDHTSTLDTVYNIGLLYASQGKIEEAEAIYQRAL